jgi:phage FluMu protein Com
MTRIPSQRTFPPHRPVRVGAPPNGRAWRCHECRRLLGIREGDRLHIRIAGDHEYVVSLPVTAKCPGCHALNELGVPHIADERC